MTLSRSSSDPVAIRQLAERGRRLATGRTRVVDLRASLDVALAATRAADALRAADLDVDQFVISSQQELDLFGGLGRAKTLLGYPVHVAHVFVEDDDCTSDPVGTAPRHAPVPPSRTDGLAPCITCGGSGRVAGAACARCKGDGTQIRADLELLADICALPSEREHA